MSQDRPIYGSDPSPAPDSEFAGGALHHLVRGSRGRLLDVRRTPVVVVDIDERVGTFAVEVLDFEDAGARWRVPFEEVDRFQFRHDGPRAEPGVVAAFGATAARLGRASSIDAEPEAAAATERRIALALAACRRHFDAHRLPQRLDPHACIAERRGDAVVSEAVRSVLAAAGLEELDERFARRHVSNPWSGELVKGHAIVAAELGLASYRGTAVRDPQLFDGLWSKARRGEHLVTRLAIARELWRRAQSPTVTLYRAGTTEGATFTHRRPSFVAATFSPAVAEAHFAGGPRTRAAWLHRQEVPVDRLLMTFWETPAMNARYAEAEALLIGGDDVLF